jgi:hypothetical protein
VLAADRQNYLSIFVGNAIKATVFSAEGFNVQKADAPNPINGFTTRTSLKIRITLVISVAKILV